MLFLESHFDWVSAHGTVSQSGLTRAIPTNSGDWRKGLAALLEVVERAQAAGTTLTATGAGWSLSNAIEAPGWLVATRQLNAVPFIGLSAAQSPHPNAGRFVFAQGGIEVGTLHKILADRGASLFTSGASCGQTLAGAISTGTHGSAVNVGSLQDSVRALHLVVGPDRHVVVQPHTTPAVSKAFCDTLGAECVSDDSLFESALVSFGTFGLIHGVVIEVEPLFVLRRHRIRVPYSDALKAVTTGENGVLEFDDSLLVDGSNELYHVDFVINPNDVNDKGTICQVMYRDRVVGVDESYAYNDKNPKLIDRSDDVVEVVGRLKKILGALANPRVRQEVEKIVATRYPMTGSTPEYGVLGELFARTDFPPGGTCIEIGVDVSNYGKALSATIDAVARKNRPFAGLISARFVPASKAMLAFTRFAPTCAIEIPAMADHHAIPTFGRVLSALKNQAIPFTLHWGQATFFDTFPVTEMYPASAIESWKSARSSLLDGPGQATFRNRMAEEAGLI